MRGKQETEPQIHLHDVRTNMKKPTVSTIIFSYLKEHEGEWIAGYSFVNRTVGVGDKTYFCGSSSDRKARLMAEEGKIERKREGKYAYYRVPKPTPIIAQKSLAFIKEMA